MSVWWQLLVLWHSCHIYCGHVLSCHTKLTKVRLLLIDVAGQGWVRIEMQQLNLIIWTDTCLNVVGKLRSGSDLTVIQAKQIVYLFVVLFCWLEICKIEQGTDNAQLGQVLIIFIASNMPSLSLSDADSFSELCMISSCLLTMFKTRSCMYVEMI